MKCDDCGQPAVMFSMPVKDVTTASFICGDCAYAKPYFIRSWLRIAFHPGPAKRAWMERQLSSKVLRRWS
jgi:hypothetical protein